MTEIAYNFGANEETLEHIQRAINDIRSIHEDVDTIFKTLPDLYIGQQADALQEQHHDINNKLQSLLHELESTRSAAVDQQHEMQALDSQLAGGF
jgi:uncharacterized protein YukE